MRRVLTVAIASTFLMVALANEASAVFIADPADGHGRLDMIGVAARHGDGEIRVWVKTEWAYGCDYFRHGSGNKMFVAVVEPGLSEAVYFLLCRSDGWIIKSQSDPGFGRALRPRPNTVVMHVPTYYGTSGHAAIVVRTRDTTARGCSRLLPCKDRAPNAGFLSV